MSAGDTADLADRPGGVLVRTGLDDLHAGRATVEAMLVASASVRLTALGFDVPHDAVHHPEAELYRLVAEDVGEARAHSRYNALRRQLASFLRASYAVPS